MQVTRERHEVNRPGYFCERQGRGGLRCIGIRTHPATAEKQAEVVLPVVLARLESNRVHFSECLSKLGQSILILCSPSSSPTSRGVCTAKRRRFNDLGEMRACLQSRCSPS
jgi:hypothetical protein